MKKVISLITFIAISLAVTSAFAQTASHAITVDVQAINEVSISNAALTLTINSATAGSNPDSVSDATATMSWTTNQSNMKITVASSITTPTVALTVTAGILSGGTTGGKVAITGGAVDVVTGIATTTGSATLTYEATAEASDGVVNEAHTLTYTITPTGI